MFYASMVHSCWTVLGIALGTMMPTLFSTAQDISVSYCSLPIDDKRIRYVAHRNLEVKAAPGTDLKLDQVHVIRTNFTCLATRGLNRYTSATVVAELNLTNPAYSSNPMETFQFQMGCVKGKWTLPTDHTTFDITAPDNHFEIPLESHCYECTASFDAGLRPRYDSKSNCDHCPAECKALGAGFCTGSSKNDCCPYFNPETKLCTSDCTTINPNYIPNSDFVCECSLNCTAGYTADDNCTKCQVFEQCLKQPCQHGGVCQNDPSSPNLYNCTCLGNFSGPNCGTCSLDCPRGQAGNEDCTKCNLEDGCEHAGQPCQNGGKCLHNPSALGFYTCMCRNGWAGKNCSMRDCGKYCAQCNDTVGCCVLCEEGFVKQDDGCTCTMNTTKKETIQKVLKGLLQMNKKAKRFELTEWKKIGCLKKQKEMEVELEKMKGRVMEIHESMRQEKTIRREVLKELAKMNSTLQTLESFLPQRRQIIYAGQGFFEAINKWKHCTSFVKSLLADKSAPADLDQAKFMARKLSESKMKFQRSFDEVNNASNNLWDFVFAQKPIGKTTFEKLVHVKVIMRDLKAETKKVNARICKRQSCLKKWTVLFGNEHYANEVVTWIRTQQNQLHSTLYEEHIDVSLAYKLDEITKAYHNALKSLKQAKKLRALLRADSSMQSSTEKQLRATYFAFTDLYISHAKRY